MDSRPAPWFQVGDLVRTKAGTKGDRVVKTDLIARVRIVGWHATRKEWIYYLEGNSRRHRWYLAEDLEPVADRRDPG